MMSQSSALQLHDARPFFEKALVYGVQHGILDADRLAAIHTDAPKGMVQIARYFGSEFLRPELEKARDRMVNPSACTCWRPRTVIWPRQRSRCATTPFCRAPRAGRTCSSG